MSKKGISRRDFLVGSATAASLFTFLPKRILGQTGVTPSANEKLNIACIGIGGMGANDVASVSNENIVALCDVDDRHAAETYNQFPKARKYHDYRVMLEKEEKNIDAVTVSTPDHTHAIIAMMAIKMGKHVYCQKPLAHNIFEVRQLTEMARKQKVVTQMGIHIHATETMKLFVEMIKSGMIGPVREVHLWCDRTWGCGAIQRPQDTPAVPDTLQWDLWLGPAADRPYHPVYLPGKWRGWWDFGTGSLGDMGCHIFDPAFWALDLTHPTTVEAAASPFSDEGCPQTSMVRYEFPARGELPPVTLTWYDGGLKPWQPGGFELNRAMPENGGLYIGDRGTILLPHVAEPRLIPESRMKDFKQPEKILPRGMDHYQEWIQACKGGRNTLANFDYAGPLTEAVILGNVAVRTRKKIHWDAEVMKVTNLPEADQYLRRTYRKGWTL
ncbi:MAG: Inositol 2-dehydrogenase [Planctomycetes bacterium ADurb.Bin412]|nr:MAG: Inositol 2-dehydrogenase [Planctomycetes bacterium ADurb.Bin412]